MEALINRVEGMLKTHPNVLIFILAIAIAGMTFNYNVFAQSVDVEKRFQEVGQTITALESKMDGHINQYSIGNLISRIADQESEIFSLERLESNGAATDRDLGRLSMLISEKAQNERELDRLLAQ